MSRVRGSFTVPLRVDITNRQAVGRVSAARLKGLALFFMREVTSLVPSLHWRDVHVVLMSDAEIAGVNERFLGHAGPTDVISFRYAPVAGDALDAEIIVNVQRALAVGPQFGGVARELALYIAHGCDHLTGENDRTVKQRQRMRRREQRWLQKAASAGLLRDLFTEKRSC
jgi:rRNA maturation RNase YbeY